MAIENFQPLRILFTSRQLRDYGFGGLTDFRLYDKKDAQGLMNFEQLIALPTDDLRKALKEKVGPLVQKLLVLTRDGKFGVFNDHTLPHIEFVDQKANELLDKAGNKDITTHNIATTIAWLHDLGNLFHRHGHSQYSVRLLPEILTNYDPKDTRFLSIVYGIYLHDEAIGSQVGDFKDFMPAEFYAPAVFSAIAADKLHIDRKRLSKNITSLEGLDEEARKDIKVLVEREKHTAISLYAETCDTRFFNDFLGETGLSFLLEIGFSSKIGRLESPELIDILRRFQYNENGKPGDIYADEEWYKAHKRDNISYADLYRAMVEQIYCIRFAIMNSCLFALFPDLNVVRFGVRDNNTWIKIRGFEEYYRKEWQNALFHAWKIQNEGSFKAGKIRPPLILKKGYDNYLRQHTFIKG